jgi:peptidoglycan hydrolase-like protein with peptidoglycan-binding domain
VPCFRAAWPFLISAGLFAAPPPSTSVHASSHAPSAHHIHRSARRRPQHRIHGQQSIDPERVTQIQQALIRAHYLNGEPSGQWDPTTIAAMRQYQSDHGWQTKLMPDSRALKKLGLGPDYSNALNAQNASFAVRPSTSAIPAQQSAGFAAASGVNQ